MFVRFLRFITGVKPKPTFVLGRPIPPSLRRATPVSLKHDRRISAGIFSEPPRKEGGDKVYRLAVWKSYQTPAKRWQVSTSFFPDEIDPALRLLEECRRSMPST